MTQEKQSSSRLKNVRKELSRVFVIESAKFILGILFTATSFVFISQALLASLSVVTQFGWFIGILSGLGGAWLFIVLRQRYSKHRPRFQSLDFDYCITRKELIYEFQDRQKMTYKKKVSLKALRHGLNVYHDKYNWTGKGQVNVTSSIQEQRFRLTNKKNIWQLYEIQLPKTLSKGESIDTEVVWELEDGAGDLVPFFSATIEEPVEFLELTLVLPPSLGIKQVACEVYSSIGAKKPLSSKTEFLDRDGKITWAIKAPKLLHHYEINWVPVLDISQEATYSK